MANDDVRPALTAEEWADTIRAYREAGFASFPAPVAPELFGLLHQTAAIALYGQSFGFTRGDLGLLRGLYLVSPDGADLDQLWSLICRVEALLPPESE